MLPANHHSTPMNHLYHTTCGVILLCAISVCGCSEPEIVDYEPKRPDDRISEAELESFLSIIDSLPDQKLPSMPSVMLPAPQWNRNRSLPVNELVNEDEKARIEHGSIDWLAAHFTQSRFLKRGLRRERMTISQFIGLYLALGTSLCRDGVPPDRDLEQILIRGKRAIVELKKDHRAFSALPEDLAYLLQEQSGWLAVVDRAARLNSVHPDNRALVQKHHERLVAVIPAEFLRKPFLEFATLLDDRGIPFQEPFDHETDDHLEWSRDQALVGTDTPEEKEGI